MGILKITNLKIWHTFFDPKLKLPLYFSSVSAGFPSPADDYIENWLSLDELLIKDKSATFFMSLDSNDLIPSGIFRNDLLIVNTAKKPTHGSFVVANINGLQVFRQLQFRNGKPFLVAGKTFEPINLDDDLIIFGKIDGIARNLGVDHE